MTHRRWIGAFLCLAAIAVAVSVPFLSFTIDDAFITFRQAARLAHGSLSYNASSMIEASSSLIHVILIALILRIPHATPEVAAHALGVLGILATAAALTWHVREHAGSDRGMLPAAMALPAVVLTGTSLSTWWFLGLETPLWVAALVVGAAGIDAWAWRDRDGGRRAALAVAILLPLLRPEGGLIAVAWLAALALMRPSSWPRLRWLLLAAALTSVVAGVGRLLLFGLWFPAPVYLKAPTAQRWRIIGGMHYLLHAFTFDPHDPGAWLFAACVLIAAGWWLIPMTRRRVAGRLMDAAPFLIPCALLMAMAVLVGGDWMPASRLVVPTFPLLGMAVVAAGHARRSRILPLVVVTAATALGVMTHAGELRRGLFAVSRTADPCRNQLGDDLARFGKASEVLAVADIGLLGYRFPGDVLDYFGVANPTLARAGRGNGVASAEDVLKDRPAWLLVYASGQVVAPTWPIDVDGYIRPVTESLARSEMLWREYKVFDQCQALPGHWAVLMRR